MRVLALDTTTRSGSVALVCDGAVIETAVGDPGRLVAERLPGDVLDLLGRHHLGPSDVDVFVVAIGPGSFTGLRIGIAAIQGLAFATRRPVVGVSALEALAHAALGAGVTGDSQRVGVWMDAQRDEVFTAAFDPRQTSRLGLTCLEDPAVGPPAAVAQRWRTQAGAGPFVVTGDGAVRYADLLRPGDGRPFTVIPPPPMAPSLAMLGAARAAAGMAGLPHAIRPLYVRRPDAELARDRNAGPAAMNAHRIEWLAGPEDLDGVLDVDRASFARPWTREMYEEEIRHPDRSFIAVLRLPERRVGGYISFWLVVDELHINNVAVRPEARAHGFGRRLVEFALEEGANRGAAVALLEVRRSNAAARRLYERLGFREVGVRTAYYAEPVEDAVLLRRFIRNLESNPTA